MRGGAGLDAERWSECMDRLDQALWSLASPKGVPCRPPHKHPCDAGLCDVADVQRTVRTYDAVYGLSLPPALVGRALDQSSSPHRPGCINIHLFMPALAAELRRQCDI